MSSLDSIPPGHSDVTTQGIRVRVGAQWMEEHDFPDPNKEVYVYRVMIENLGDQWAKLCSRRWVIKDADGHSEVVEGPGVVGNFPELDPGYSFRYHSFCPLDSEWGSMEGTFTFERADGSTFEAEVGRFFLAKTAAPLV